MYADTAAGPSGRHRDVPPRRALREALPREAPERDVHEPVRECERAPFLLGEVVESLGGYGGPPDLLPGVQVEREEDVAAVADQRGDVILPDVGSTTGVPAMPIVGLMSGPFWLLLQA